MSTTTVSKECLFLILTSVWPFIFYFCFFLLYFIQGRARTQSPTIKNNALEFLTFGEIDWLQRQRSAMPSLLNKRPPYGSRYSSSQVSMPCSSVLRARRHAQFSFRGAARERATLWNRHGCIVFCRFESELAQGHVYSGLFSPRINLSPFTKDFRGKRRQMSLGSIFAGKSLWHVDQS